ncbi:MAG: histidine ammonia-lyase [Bdellovibrionia bacterium]
MQINGESIRLENLYQAAYDENIKVTLAESSKMLMQKSRSYIEGRIANGEVMYGVNTGFGAFSSVRISDQEIEQLQRNLIRSHSMGIGTPFTKNETRAMMILRANALAKGHSGIRPVVVEKILEFLNNDIIPVVPSQGSVGASGDLAPLSHLALALIGEGEAWSQGQVVPVQTLLKQKNIIPLELKAKEGLSLINGCQVMTAIGLLSLYQARELLALADLAGAMSLEGLRGSRKAFDPLISATRPHVGEGKTARNILKLAGATSQIGDSHLTEDHRVQDAYSLRCMPAVHGSAKDAIRFAIQVLEVEANSSTDNPLVFADDNKVLSCGNFHGMPVAHAMDFAAIALASQASISECRISKLISTQMSELPPFLTPQGGLNSGHMIVQVAAASLVSENKVLTHPASVDSIPTSAEKEDHVSMGTIAARKFHQVLKNAQNIVAMEFLSAAQAVDLVAPLKPAAAVAAAHELIRSEVPFAKEDRIFAKDVEKIRLMMESGKLNNCIRQTVGEIEL